MHLVPQLPSLEIQSVPGDIRCYVTRNLACSILQIVALAPAKPTDIIVFI